MSAVPSHHLPQQSAEADAIGLVGLVIDVRQRRPACVLLQAAYGGNHHLVSSLFDAGTWLIAPTDDMRMVLGTREEWARFADEANAANTRPRRMAVSPASSSQGGQW